MTRAAGVDCFGCGKTLDSFESETRKLRNECYAAYCRKPLEFHKPRDEAPLLLTRRCWDGLLDLRVMWKCKDAYSFNVFDCFRVQQAQDKERPRRYIIIYVLLFIQSLLAVFIRLHCLCAVLLRTNWHLLSPLCLALSCPCQSWRWRARRDFVPRPLKRWWLDVGCFWYKPYFLKNQEAFVGS